MSKAEKIKAEKTKELKALIAGYLIRSGYSKEDLALQLNISLASLYNKIVNVNEYLSQVLANI